MNNMLPIIYVMNSAPAVRLAAYGSLLFIVLLIMLLPAVATAEDGNKPEKIFVDADHMQANIKTGYSTYTGNVRVRQGDLVLTGDSMIIEQNNNEVDQITVTGNPARYDHVTEDGLPIEAISEKMVYTTSKNLLVMTTNAKLLHPEHQISSQKIIYNTLTKVAIAGDKDTGQGKERVQITLTPKKDVQTE